MIRQAPWTTQSWSLAAAGVYKWQSQLSAEVLKSVEQNLDEVLLNGLDGGIKNRYPIQTFSLEQIFNEIDLMPMRRIESNE